jgi:hypothetical protein
LTGRLDVEPWRSWKLAMLELAEWDLPASGTEVEVDQPPAVDPRLEAADRTPSDYGIGRRSLERLLAHEIATSAPVQDQIEAFIRIADWDWMGGVRSQALEEYELAQEMLEEAEHKRRSMST